MRRKEARRKTRPRRACRRAGPRRTVRGVQGQFPSRTASGPATAQRCRAIRPAARQQRLRSPRGDDWVVYAKTPLAGPAAVLDYPARYTHCTSIGNERLVAIARDQVLLRVRADACGAKRVIAVPGEQCIGRPLQHVLPPGFKRIRHDGLLAPAAKTERLTLARRHVGHAAGQPSGARRRADLHAPCSGHPDRVLRALQARPLAHCRAARCRPCGDRGAPCSADAGRLPRAGVSRMLHRLSMAGSACHRRPEPSSVSLPESARRATYRHCHIDGAQPSSPVCGLGLAPTFNAGCVSIAADTGR